MRVLFADTFYWVGLLNKQDQWHSEAVEATRTLGSARIVTTQEVLVEMLNALAAQGPHLRRAASQYVETIPTRNNTEVIQQTPRSFAAGLERYQARPDQSFSLTDCISMVTMEARGIYEVLIGDHHFEQAGFVRLFKERQGRRRP